MFASSFGVAVSLLIKEVYLHQENNPADLVQMQAICLAFPNPTLKIKENGAG